MSLVSHLYTVFKITRVSSEEICKYKNNFLEQSYLFFIYRSHELLINTSVISVVSLNWADFQADRFLPFANVAFASPSCTWALNRKSEKNCDFNHWIVFEWVWTVFRCIWNIWTGRKIDVYLLFFRINDSANSAIRIWFRTIDAGKKTIENGCSVFCWKQTRTLIVINHGGRITIWDAVITVLNNILSLIFANNLILLSLAWNKWKFKSRNIRYIR